jgi:hypothetical protein
MWKKCCRLVTGGLVALALASPRVVAQFDDTDASPTDPAQTADAQAADAQAQTDQLLAPVALYPDSLLAQVLMASTYPLELVKAQHWLQQNPGLTGNALPPVPVLGRERQSALRFPQCRGHDE